MLESKTARLLRRLRNIIRDEPLLQTLYPLRKVLRIKNKLSDSSIGRRHLCFRPSPGRPVVLILQPRFEFFRAASF